MDKHILYVKSEIDSTKSLENKNLMSFHKRLILSMNSTVAQELGIFPGYYATFKRVDKQARQIVVTIVRDRPTKVYDKLSNTRWYKITEPQVGRYNKYCYIRTASLLYDLGMLLYGCFTYELCYQDTDGARTLIINY